MLTKRQTWQEGSRMHQGYASLVTIACPFLADEEEQDHGSTNVLAHQD